MEKVIFSKSTLKKDLRASVADGAAFGVMVGIGETYLPAFALALSMGSMVAGLIATVPMLAGGLLQLVSPFAVRRLRSHRRWVLLCTSLQALSFLPLIAAALLDIRYDAAQDQWLVVGLFAVTALYWGTGLASGPAWNTWVGTIVPAELRPRFFAWRSRLGHAFVLIGFVSGGMLLQWSYRWEHPMLAFAWLFLAALTGRLLSVWFLSRQSEPVPMPENTRHITFREFFARCRSSTDGRLLLYFASVQLTVWIAAPFFTPFMLVQLELSYGGFVAITAASFIIKIILLPILAQRAQQFGARRLLWLGGIGLVPLPALWLVSDWFPYLLLINLFAGAFWAAYELATILLFFETIPAEERTGVLTLFNVVNTCALAVGSLLGALLMGIVGYGYEAYIWLFLVSTVCRAVTLIFLKRTPSPELEAVPVAMRTISVRPSTGSVDAPVLPSIGESPQEHREE